MKRLLIIGLIGLPIQGLMAGEADYKSCAQRLISGTFKAFGLSKDAPDEYIQQKTREKKQTILAMVEKNCSKYLEEGTKSSSSKIAEDVYGAETSALLKKNVSAEPTPGPDTQPE